jgi:predicted RNA binding protein YcfA (HicA-like mRNA interferase family)
MSEIPELSFTKIIRCLQRLGFVVVRQRGSHIRLHKRTESTTIKITVPAHNPVRTNTLRQILKQSNIDLQDFKDNL